MKQQLRSISMVLAFIVGGIFYKQFAPFEWWLSIGIAAMLSMTFIGLDVHKLRPVRMHLWLLLSIQVLGIGSWGLARLAGYPVLAESLYYCAAAPIASASPIIVGLLRGNVEFSTTAMVLSQIVFAFVTPFILPFTVHDQTMGYLPFAGVVARQIFIVVGVPALIATMLRLIYPPCKTWAAKLKDVSLGIWVCNLLVLTAGGVQRIIQRGYSLHDMWPMMLAAAAVCFVGFTAGYRLGYPNLKRECSQGLGQKNTVLTLYLASQSYATPLAYIGPVFYVFCHNMANAIQLWLASREQKLRHAEPSSAVSSPHQSV